MVKQAYDQKSLMMGNGDPEAFWPKGDIDNPSRAEKSVQAAMKEVQEPLHKLPLDSIDKLRAAFAEKPAEKPDYVMQAVEGQPMSNRLYSLIAPDLTPEEMENIYMPSPLDVADSVAAFDRSIYGKRQNAKSNTIQLTGDGSADKFGAIPPLTDMEKYVLVQYTVSLYQRVNGYMRKVSSLLNDYSATDDPDVKKTIENQFEFLMKDTYNLETRIIAMHLMNGLAKIMAGNPKGEVRTVTRGSSQAPVTKVGLEGGKYFYDAAAQSTAVKENWASPWSVHKTQYVLNTDKWVDARPYSEMQDMDEDEMVVFPGVMFKADMVEGYKPAHELSANIETDAVAGRQVSFNKDGSSKELNTPSVKWKGAKYKMEVGSRALEGGREKVGNYEKRFKAPGRTLYHWLYGRED
jgi:hypothetical protein